MASTAFYRTALQVNPDNAAAHHYLTHSYETIGQIPLALEHGEAYARLAPAIPHAHHMWGHDLRRVGRIDDAIAAFRRTDELERAYYAAERIDPSLDWHHIHNLDLLATAYQYKGQMRRAEQTMREADALVSLTEYQEVNRRALTLFLLGRGRWQEALDAVRPLREGRFAAARIVGHSLAGHALLALGRTDEAKTALASAQKDLESIPKIAPGLVVTRASAEPWIEGLRGELLLRSGARAEGRAVLEGVERTLRGLPGPDAWIQALFRLELIARAARDVGRLGPRRVDGAPDARARSRVRGRPPRDGSRVRPCRPHGAGRARARGGTALLAGRGRGPARAEADRVAVRRAPLISDPLLHSSFHTRDAGGRRPAVSMRVYTTTRRWRACCTGTRACARPPDGEPRPISGGPALARRRSTRPAGRADGCGGAAVAFRGDEAPLPRRGADGSGQRAPALSDPSGSSAARDRRGGR